MNGSTRRGFLAGGLGAAAGAVVAGVTPASAATTDPDDTLPGDADGSLVAYVEDLHRGEVALMIEGREVVVKDKKLAARLHNAFVRAGRS